MSVSQRSGNPAAKRRETACDGNAEFRTAKGVVPSPWILNLPWILRAPIIFFYVDTLHPDDDAVTQLRKLFLSVLIFIIFGPISNMVYNIVTITSLDVGPIVARFATGIMPLVWYMSYFIVRFDVVSASTGSIFMFAGTWLSLFLAEISYPEWPIDESMLLLAIAAQLLRLPNLGMPLIMCVCGHVISTYNASAFGRSDPEVPLAMLPGAFIRTFPTRMYCSLGSLGTAVVVLTGLQLQLFESDKLTKQSTQSSALALEIAMRLADYDTECAAELLEEARHDKAADPKLIEALEVLVDNLNKYRPHLPNWLLPKTAATAKRRDSQTSSNAVRSINRRANDEQSVRSAQHSSSSQRSIDSAARRRDAAIAASDSMRGHTSPSPASASSWLRDGAVFESFVAIAKVAYLVDATPATLPISGIPALTTPDNTTSNFVDAVHRLAGQTAAAVHCFVGDTVVLTWNAASRAVQSEAKAARMVARLMAYAAETGARVHGAVVSGKARVQLAGSEGQQKALTVSAGWLDGRLSAVAAEGQRLGCIACDYATRSGGAFAAHMEAVSGRIVATASGDLPSASNHCKVAIYAIRDEIRDDGDDEWMYLLQRQQQQLPGSTEDSRGPTAEERKARLATLDDWHHDRTVMTNEAHCPIDFEDGTG